MERRGAKLAVLVAVLACAIAAFLFAIVTRADESDAPTSSAKDDRPSLTRVATHKQESDAPTSSVGDDRSSLTWVSTHERAEEHEVLPCTGPKEPINFQIFSAGPSVAGMPLTDFNRRCGATTPADESPANFTNYIYGRCGGDSSCEPPLQVQTWPACQRTLGDYSYEGKPMPYRQLPSIGDAEVVEIEFMFGPRIEVYTAASTIVLFAQDLTLAVKALEQLRSQEIGEPPATGADELRGPPDDGLAPPSDGATEGEMSC